MNAIGLGLILILLTNLTYQKSMRIFVNNAVVDVSSYLLFDFLSDIHYQKYS